MYKEEHPLPTNFLRTTLATASAPVRRATPFAVLLAALLLCPALPAQQAISLAAAANPVPLAVSESSLPDAPQPGSPQAGTPTASPQAGTQSYEHSDPQTKRILGIIPNFRAVSTTETLPRQTLKEKFTDATEDSFDYSSVVLPALVAVYNYERNSVPQFGSGGVGYSRYLWHTVVDQTIENYMVEFVVPAATHEDTRYYTLGHGGFAKRAGYSLSRVVLTRSDSGNETFNIGEVGGAALGASISNLYYPSQQRTVGNTFEQMGTNIGIDALSFMVKEFWPDINHALFHGDKPYHQPGN